MKLTINHQLNKKIALITKNKYSNEKVLSMKRLLLILILTLGFNSSINADDISDFQIEGINVGDSLLDFFSETEIKNIGPTYYPKSKKFYDLPIKSSKFIEFDQITFGVKNGDSKYLLYMISGELIFNNDLNSCMNKKKEIVNSISHLFSNQKKDDYTYTYFDLDDGNSFAKITDFIFKDRSSVRVFCTSWSKETKNKRKFTDMLSLQVNLTEYLDWLDNEAYN